MKLWSGATATTIRQGSNQMSLFWGKAVCDGIFFDKHVRRQGSEKDCARVRGLRSPQGSGLLPQAAGPASTSKGWALEARCRSGNSNRASGAGGNKHSRAGRMGGLAISGAAPPQPVPPPPPTPPPPSPHPRSPACALQEGDGKVLSPAQSAASGFVAACIGPTLNNPFDVVKTRM